MNETYYTINRKYNKEIEDIKNNIVKKYGTEPTICYFYYLWNAVDYIGEEQVRKSFESIKGQGNEIIVGDYSSSDGTPKIAKEYGFKVINVEKTKGILFHESKVENGIIFNSKSNFIVDLDVHSQFPPNMDNICKDLLEKNDERKTIVILRGLMKNRDGMLNREFSSASYSLAYRPYYYEARGIDERTYYMFGTSHYVISLLLDVYNLKFYDFTLDNIVHNYHIPRKREMFRNVFKVNNINQKHHESINFGRSLTNPLKKNFLEGIKQVHNSYW